MGQTLFTVPALLKSKVSLDRITDFLTEVCSIFVITNPLCG